ncbi:MAG TPA: SRPBCC domain-containing protein [Actinomycetota bacterium]|nr:SRPBCC domain-containing protein [Actinomycetota bacterium]
MNGPTARGGPRGILLTRAFGAPRERVWDEWTQPERFAEWYGGREMDVPEASVAMDVREGGEWRATMLVGPDRSELRFGGRYLEVVRPKLLVFTLRDQTDDDDELVTVVLSDLGGSDTEMIFRQRGSLSDAMYEQAEKGWSSFFGIMADRLGEGADDPP